MNKEIIEYIRRYQASLTIEEPTFESLLIITK